MGNKVDKVGGLMGSFFSVHECTRFQINFQRPQSHLVKAAETLTYNG